jgi:hypothetical protein
MAAKKRWPLFLLVIAVVSSTFWLAVRAHRESQPHDYWQTRVNTLRREAQVCEVERLAAKKSLDDKQNSRDWDTLDAYYEFREVEMDDQEAWRRAAKQIGNNLAGLSNRVAAVASREDALQTQLIAAEEHVNGAPPTSQ